MKVATRSRAHPGTAPSRQHTSSLRAVAFCLLLSAFCFSALAQPNAQPPGQISYQGYLTDANGFPLATNNPVNYNVQFRIYDAATVGNLKWGELQVVTVDRGYFTVMLGNGSSLPGAPSTNNLTGIFSGSDASDRYLEITVQGLAPGDPPIVPRLRLLASPYSYLASRALSIDGSGVTGGTVPDARLSSNVALRSGGNIFSGTQTNIGNLYLTSGTLFTDNGQYLYAKNSAGAYEGYLVPRWSDNGTYLNFGEGGFNLRDQRNSYYMTVRTNGQIGFGGPLLCPSTLGDKISLWGGVGNVNFGFGIQGSLLQMHTDNSASDIAFGYGQSSAMTETVRIKGNGNVGIGTPSPGAKLDVRGDVKMGATGNLYASGSTENLRIVRGIVRNDGTIFNGSGFTITKTATGSYTLNFTTPFADVPAVTISPTAGVPPLTASWNNGTVNSLLVYTISGSTLVDAWWMFIAVGAR